MTGQRAFDLLPLDQFGTERWVDSKGRERATKTGPGSFDRTETVKLCLRYRCMYPAVNFDVQSTWASYACTYRHQVIVCE